MKHEFDLKQVPITIETAHQFFNKRQMSFIIKLYKNVYKEGFINGAKLAVCFLFLTTICYSQTYVYSVKLSKTLTTTVASNPTIYKQNIFDLKECKDNTDALSKGVKINEYYKLPMKDNVVLIAIVVAPLKETTGTIENQTIYLSKEK